LIVHRLAGSGRRETIFILGSPCTISTSAREISFIAYRVCRVRNRFNQLTGFERAFAGMGLKTVISTKTNQPGRSQKRPSPAKPPTLLRGLREEKMKSIRSFAQFLRDGAA
jgi:hypothetical protein